MSFMLDFNTIYSLVLLITFDCYMKKGTVDSGHLCLSGYNEVVMLRRLPERHKCNALNLLTGSSQSSHDTLYGLPHRDNLVRQFWFRTLVNRNLLRSNFTVIPQDPTLGWPTKESIGKCKEMG